MSELERRCRLVLTAYPPEYRRERGEEILGTLLEATPQGRDWPRARDVRALISGGLRARAAANRRLSTAADIRLGVLLGVAIVMSANAAGFLRDFATSSAAFATAQGTAASGWRELLAGVLLAAAVACAWLGRRRLLAACAPLAAAAVIWLLIHQPAYADHGTTVWTVSAGAAGTLLLCMAALILLARRDERPAKSWLWLIGLIVATEVLPVLMPGGVLGVSWIRAALLLTTFIVPIAWTVVDARPALGLATYLALGFVALLGDAVRVANAAPTGPVLASAAAMWPLSSVLLAVTGLALWRLRRRQAVH
jgi:hypothetical protein